MVFFVAAGFAIAAVGSALLSSGSNNAQSSPSNNTQSSPSNNTQSSPSNNTQASPSNNAQSSPSNNTQASPSNQTKTRSIPLSRTKTWRQYRHSISANRDGASCLFDTDDDEAEERLKGTFANTDLNDKVSFYEGDITLLEVDAIVSAASTSLGVGTGVDGAIHKAAGPGLAAEMKGHNGCKVGEAKISGGHNLPAKHVISTATPGSENHEALTNCYINSMKILVKEGLRTIAFPCLATGNLKYPNAAACDIALNAVKTFLEENPGKIDRIVFCIFSDVDKKLYIEKMKLCFPPIYYHYTTTDGLQKIQASGKVLASRRDNSGQVAAFGDGAYLTTVPPTEGQIHILCNNYSGSSAKSVDQRYKGSGSKMDTSRAHSYIRIPSNMLDQQIIDVTQEANGRDVHRTDGKDILIPQFGTVRDTTLYK